MINLDNAVTGDKLSQADQRHVLNAFVHRYTGEHIPNWARTGRMADGKQYPVQFADDQDWLRNTRFEVTATGKLRQSVRECYATPTWPRNPELRTRAA